MFAVIVSLLAPAQAQTVPTVDLTASLGDTPVAEAGMTVETSASAGDELVEVTLHPPRGGDIDVLYSAPAPFSDNRDGSWSATLDADAYAAATVVWVVSDATGSAEAVVRLDTETQTAVDGRVSIGVEPQAGWIGDLIDSILTVDVCWDILDNSQNPSQSSSLDVWQYCKDLVGL